MWPWLSTEAQRGCVFSILGDIKNPTEHQSAWPDPPHSRVWVMVISRDVCGFLIIVFNEWLACWFQSLPVALWFLSSSKEELNVYPSIPYIIYQFSLLTWHEYSWWENSSMHGPNQSNWNSAVLAFQYPICLFSVPLRNSFVLYYPLIFSSDDLIFIIMWHWISQVSSSLFMLL